MKAMRVIVVALGAVVSCAGGATERDSLRFLPQSRLELSDAKLRLRPMLTVPNWVGREIQGGFLPAKDGSRRWTINPGHGERDIKGRTVLRECEGAVTGIVSMAFADAVKIQQLSAWIGVIPREGYAGGKFVFDGTEEIALPEQPEKGVLGHKNLKARKIEAYDAKGVRRFAFELERPVGIILQDERFWRRDEFEFRLLFQSGGTVPADAKFSLAFALRGEKPIRFSADRHRLKPGPEWVPLDDDTLAVKEGSALDISAMRPTDAPAGRHGRVIATKDGHFAFEDAPDKPVRFYGVNLCSGATVLDPERARPLAKMLVARGFNTVRFHHQDGALSAGIDTPELKPERLANFDAVVAACVAEGLYMTLDLQVTRRVSWRACGIDRDGRIEDKHLFKSLVQVSEPAFSNYVAFTRNLLTHINPLTGRSLAQEPALAWISLVNEGNLGNGGMIEFESAPQFWLPKWRAWLQGKRAADPKYAAIPETLPTVRVDRENLKPSEHHLAFLEFLADTETAFARRMKAFLRSIGCKALLTNMNAWHYPVNFQPVRAFEYDYVDEHFYGLHPKFLNLPSKRPPVRQDQVNPLEYETRSIPLSTVRRIFSRPLTVTEWNWPAPQRYRAAGGLLIGTLASLQDWDGLWRFTWSHSGEGIESVKPLCDFDIAGDPIGRAEEFAMVPLFLRGDATPLVEAQAVGPTMPPHNPVYLRNDDRLLSLRKRTGHDLGLGVPPVSRKGPAAETSLDVTNGVFRIATERTCGIAAEKGSHRAGRLAVKFDGVPATIWVTALDGKPLDRSERMLVVHATDAKMTDMEFLDDSMEVLLDWGHAPTLVRKARAEMQLAIGDRNFKVYALGSDGTRRETVATASRDGRLCFVADTGRNPACATIYYEIVAL